jgi:hypothetical protein
VGAFGARVDVVGIFSFSRRLLILNLDNHQTYLNYRL